MTVKVHSVVRHDDPHQVIMQYHRCDWRKWKFLMTPDGEYDKGKMTGEDDIIEWPVGEQGQGMPRFTPFATHAMCPACEEWLTKWFEWR